MTDNDIKIVCEKIDSLHEKILKSKFVEAVTESEMFSLILAVMELNNQKAKIEDLEIKNEHLVCFLAEAKYDVAKEFVEWLQENEIINKSKDKRLRIAKKFVEDTKDLIADYADCTKY
jgi:hypothetical protein